jgi:RNA polymerase sigma-70 factor, ECF subfamily
MAANQTTSLSLLERIRVRDDEAWQRLVELYRPLVAYWCQRWGARWEDGEEITQEVFLAVSSSLEQFEHQRAGSFRGWIRGITRHKLLDHFRRRQGEPAASGGSDAYRRLQDLPDLPADEAEEVSSLYRRAANLMRAQFEERTWQAFWQTAVEGRDTGLVSAELQMSAVAVRIAKSRVLARLREQAACLID